MESASRWIAAGLRQSSRTWALGRDAHFSVGWQARGASRSGNRWLLCESSGENKARLMGAAQWSPAVGWAKATAPRGALSLARSSRKATIDGRWWGVFGRVYLGDTRCKAYCPIHSRCGLMASNGRNHGQSAARSPMALGSPLERRGRLWPRSHTHPCGRWRYEASGRVRWSDRL